MNATKKRRETYEEYLLHVPILGNLDRLERLKIADALETVTFADGVVIVREGEEGFNFYIILEGQVKITKDGTETPNSPLEPGQYFGELALINDEKRAATCTAIGVVRVATMDRHAFTRLLGPCKEIMSRKGYPGMHRMMMRRRMAVSAEPLSATWASVNARGISASPDQPPSTMSAEQLATIDAVLGNHVMLRHLEFASRMLLYGSMTTETFPPEADIIVQGDTNADKLYIVQSGMRERQ